MNTTDPKAAMTRTDADEPDLGGDCDGLDDGFLPDSMTPRDLLGDRWAPIIDAARKSGAQAASTVKLPRGMDLHDVVFSGQSIREDAARSNTITLDPSTAPRVTNTVWVAPGGRTIPASAVAFHVDGPDFRHATIVDSKGRPIGRLTPETEARAKDLIERIAQKRRYRAGVHFDDTPGPDGTGAKSGIMIEVPAEGWPPRWNPALGYTGWMDGPPDGVGVHKRRGARLPNTEPVRRAAWVLEGAR